MSQFANLSPAQKMRIVALGAVVGLMGVKGYERHKVLEEFESKTPAIASYLDSIPSGLSNVEFSHSNHKYRTEIDKTSNDPDIARFTVREVKFDSAGKVKDESKFVTFTLRRDGPSKVTVEKDPNYCECATYKYVIKHPYDLSQLKVPR